MDHLPRRIAIDTSCVVNLLSDKEAPNQDVLDLVHLAFNGRVSLTVTPVLLEEVPTDVRDGEAAGKRSTFIRERLRMFVVEEIEATRIEERNRLATSYIKLLWPSGQEGSRTRNHCLADCKHIASHHLCGGKTFVTLDEKLISKARLHRDQLPVQVVHPSEVIRLFRKAAPAQEGTSPRDMLVRRAREDDGASVTALLQPLRQSYPNFDVWWQDAVRKKATYVCSIDGELLGVSVWSFKDRRVVKLSTFFVSPEFQGRGLGSYLLFHQLRCWVRERVEKVYVTISTDHLEILPFFLQYGFRIEGASSRRYKSGTTELVVSKHLFYERVTDDEFDEFLTRLGRDVFCLPAEESLRCQDNWFMPPTNQNLTALRDEQERVIEVVVGGGATDRRVSLGSLAELVYPARLALTGMQAFMIPIQPQWADRMMAIPRSQEELFPETDKRRLRTDNAYYCHPRHSPESLQDAPALFYISAPDSFVAGFARILDCHVAVPDILFAQFGSLGIYSLEDIQTHIRRSDGKVMALRFGWWVPFERTVGLQELREVHGVTHPQSICAVSYEKFEQLLQAGGIDW